MTSEPVKYLGTFLAKQDKAEHLNFEAALVKMCRIGSRWRKRSLTLRAQVLILKCMIFSVFTHVLNTVSMSAKWLEMIQKFANDFLWQGWNKLSPKKCWNLPTWGGLNHLHVKHFFISL